MNDEANKDEVIARYWTMRRRCERALLCLAAAVLVLVVFHNPSAWGDGVAAWALTGLAWFLVPTAGLVAYAANGKMAEARGYCQGRFGESPADTPD